MAATACPRCLTRFDCGADTDGCWCAEIDVPLDVLRRLALETVGCLCRQCLTEAAASSAARAAPEPR